MSRVLLLAEDDEPNLRRLKITCQWLNAPCSVLSPACVRQSPIAWSPWDQAFTVHDASGQRFVSSDITGVWTRQYRWNAGETQHPGRRLASFELAYTWDAMLHSLSDKVWMNRPGAMSQWDNRLSQARLAHSLGWRVPDSIVTNDPGRAREFLRTHGEIIVKHISPGSSEQRADRVLVTQAIKQDQAALLDHVKWSPTLLQERVYKAFELRAIVVGDQVFSGAIQPTKDARSEVDGRLWVKTDLRFSRTTLDSALQQRLVELTKAMGLVYGAVDLIVDANGQVFFLELNCSGQWGFIEGATGLPISEAIVQVLSGGKRGDECAINIP